MPLFPPAKDIRVAVKTANQTVASTTPANCTDLGFTGLKANTYYTFEFNLIYSAAATTTGLRIAVDYTGTVTSIRYGANIPTTATAASWAAVNTDAGQITAANSTVTLSIATIAGAILTNATGDLNLQIAGDAAANLTVELNSYGRLMEAD